jgi:hypothetical protein
MSPETTEVVHPVSVVELLNCCEDRVGLAAAVMVLVTVGIALLVFHTSITADPLWSAIIVHFVIVPE